MIAPRLIYIHDWYDYPISGLIEVTLEVPLEDAGETTPGEIAWFFGDPYAGEWTAYALSDEDRAFELAEKARAEENVGTHWSFDIPVEERRVNPNYLEYAKRPTAEAEREATRERRHGYIDESREIGTFSKFSNSLRRFA